MGQLELRNLLCQIVRGTACKVPSNPEIFARYFIARIKDHAPFAFTFRSKLSGATVEYKVNLFIDNNIFFNVISSEIMK